MNELGHPRWGEFTSSGEKIQVICLGSKVWRAFELPRTSDWFDERGLEDEFWMVKFPHPSGLNHELNDPMFVRSVSERLRYIAQGDRHGGNPVRP